MDLMAFLGLKRRDRGTPSSPLVAIPVRQGGEAQGGDRAAGTAVSVPPRAQINATPPLIKEITEEDQIKIMKLVDRGCCHTANKKRYISQDSDLFKFAFLSYKSSEKRIAAIVLISDELSERFIQRIRHDDDWLNADNRMIFYCPEIFISKVNGMSSEAGIQVDDNISRSEFIDLIKRMNDRGASEIFLDDDGETMTMHARIKGRRVFIKHFANREMFDRMLRAGFNINSRAGAGTYTRAKVQSVTFNAKDEPRLRDMDLVAVRMEYVPVRFEGRGLNIRLLPAIKIGTIDSLIKRGYTEEQVGLLRDAIDLPNGIIMTVAPTGNGKTSTNAVITYGMLAEHPWRFIIEISDPLEIVIDGIRQLVVEGANEEAKNEQYKILLKSALRQDPNAISIQEIRDAETARILVQAAATGNLSVTSFHANSATHAFQRLRDMVDENRLFDASVFRVIIAQRLCLVLCPECKMPMRERIGRDHRLFQQILAMPPAPFWVENSISSEARMDGLFVARPGGCPKCNNSGYSGLEACAEILVTNDEFMRIYREQGESAAKKHWREKMSGVTMEDVYIDRMIEGRYSPECFSDYFGPLATSSQIKMIEDTCRERHS